ncbi:hypothetical protein FRC11_007773, partial [Ceratobasidium sp. 423]
DEGPGGAAHQMTGGRSRLREYEGVERSVLKWAGRAYTAIMATQGMYETDLGTLGKRQLEAWKIGCAKYEVDPKMLPIGIGHIKNMNDRLVAWRGKSRDSVRQYVEAAFFREDWSANTIKARVKELKAGGLHTKPGARRGTGYFQHDILQTCLEKIFFKTYRQKNKKDIAMDFPELFTVPSAELICFICAIIHALVDEYDTGVQDKDNLEFEAQRKAYLAHMLSHQNFLIKNMRRWVMIQEQMPVRAFARAGASYSAITDEIEKNTIPEDEIMSDNPGEEEVSTWKDERAELDPQALNAQVPGAWGADDEPNGPQEGGPQDGLQEGGPQDGPQEGGPQDGPQGDGPQDRLQEGGRQDGHNRDQAEQEGLDGEVVGGGRDGYADNDNPVGNGNLEPERRAPQNLGPDHDRYPNGPYAYRGGPYNNYGNHHNDPRHHWDNFYRTDHGHFPNDPRSYRDDRPHYPGGQPSYQDDRPRYRYDIPGLHYRDFGGPDDPYSRANRGGAMAHQTQYQDEYGDDHPNGDEYYGNTQPGGGYDDSQVMNDW